MTYRLHTLTVAICALIPLAHADQGSFSNSGGSGSGGGGIYISGSAVASPAGSLSLSCPGGGPATCAGGNLSYASSDGTTLVNASFTSGSWAESCAGGGKGGHVSCAFSLSGYFSGSLTVNGVAQAIIGVTYQSFSSTGGSLSGVTAYNSAYIPFYYADSEQIHRSDDLMGTNQISYGNGFYGIGSIALDSAGRIYATDTYNCRVVRMDDMNGTNFTSYGACGAGPGLFSDPDGIAVDATGRIYVMDAGNMQVVRMDDMNGTNWAAYGSAGSGVGQFSQWLTSVAVDSSSRIYVADTGNRRVVRFDDMTGANWTALTQSVPINGATYSFQSPAAVTVDATGRIYVADNTSYQPEVVRVNDMTGANWTYIWTGANSGLKSIALDSSGTIFLAANGAKIVVNMTAVLNSSGSIGPIGSYYVFGVTPIPQPNPRPSAISFNPPTLDFSQNVGTTGTSAITITNFGGSPLHLGTISLSGPFTQTNTCGSLLTAGTTCTVSVTFAPTATGSLSGTLSVTDDSGNLGGAQTIVLTGTGTAPAATLSSTSLNFSSTIVGATSTARSVTLTDSGTGPMNVSSVSVTGPYSQTNTCSVGLVSGGSCTISVTFSPIALGSAPGTLTIVDDAGTQHVTLSGTGSAQISLSPQNLEFTNTVVGATSAASTVTVSNRGTTTLSFTSATAPAPFVVVSTTCGATIAGGANCSVVVDFAPTATGQFSGTLTINDSAPTGPQTLSLAGTGIAPVTLSASSLNFNTVVVGYTSATKNVTLTNHLSSALSFTSITVTAGFAIASNTCGGGVAAGATCTVGVSFSPSAVGSASGTLTFTDSAGTSPQTVTLSGSGSAPATLSTSSLNFGTITVGGTSSAKSVTLTNHRTGALTFSSIAATTGFAISSNTCGTSIAAGATCTVSATFSPKATGIMTGSLTFTDNALNSPQTVSLSGSGR